MVALEPPTPPFVQAPPVDLRERLAGLLVGTAIGDALGLPMEGMRGAAIERSFPKLDRYFFLGRTGFVSDDTEQSALVAQSLARSPDERAAFVRAFRRSLLGWLLRMPWSIGLGTLRACVRIALGYRRTGVMSAGNGAAMRAAILGAFFFDAPALRREWSDDLARVTHADPRAVEGARFVAELSALCITHGRSAATPAVVTSAGAVVVEPEVRDALNRAIDMASSDAKLEDAARELGCTGFVLHTVAIATFCFLRYGSEPELAISQAVRAGGDTDSNAAIVGAWVGASHGLAALPASLASSLHDGPFGPTHLCSLASNLVDVRRGTPSPLAKYSCIGALARNLALYPIVLAHAFKVLFRQGTAVRPQVKA